MRQTFSWFSCLLLLLLTTIPLSAGEAATVDDFRAAVDGRFVEALASGDPGRLAALYTDDAVVMPPNHPRVSGADDLRAFFKGLTDAGMQIEITPVETRVEHGLGVRSIDFELFDADSNLLDSGKALELWRRAGGEWLLWQDIWNSSTTPEQPEAAGTEAVSHLPGDYEWKEIIPGLDFAAVYGDWASEGHGKLVRVEPGLETPLHTHSGSYHGVVISGTVTNPYLDEAEPAPMEPSGYWFVPAGKAHVTACVSEEPCLFYTHADTLWDLQVVEE